MASTDDLRNRFLDELIGSARVLASIESAAIGEAWASGAVAEWSALGGAAGQLGGRLEEHSPLGAALVEWIEGAEPPDTGADWVTDVGRHELKRVSRLVDESRIADVGWIFEYVAPSGDRHDLSATIADGELIGLSVGPEGLAMAAVDDPASGFRIEEVSAEEGLAVLEQCLVGSVGALSESAEATIPLVVRRLGITAVAHDSPTSDRTLPPRDPDDDRYAADVLASALRTQLAMDPPDSVPAALQVFRERVSAADPDATTLFEVAGLPIPSDDVDLEVFVRLVGAYLAPRDLTAHTDAQFSALVELEPADWVGVILGLTRARVGTDIDGDALVSLINRAPEITTTIPKNDAPRISWTFEQMLFSWEVTGVLDDDGCVGAAASWLLPRAALAAWRDGGS